MCGIIGYLGRRDAAPILLNGLKRLEYRGYDSAGVCVVRPGSLQILKKQGKVAELGRALEDTPMRGTVGMGHTRWATHGVPNDANAHPHLDASGNFAIVHNGIIENHASLKQLLERQGVQFSSDTDTEVLVQWISRLAQSESLSLAEAVQLALKEVVGAYGIVVASKNEPGTLVAARMGSPLVLGVGDGEIFLASDATPIIEHTRNVVYLDDGDMIIARDGQYEIRRIHDNHVVAKNVERIELELEAIERGGFPHYMLKEIHDQVFSIEDTLRGRLSAAEGRAHLGGIRDYAGHLERADRIYITACGTSWHAALIGAYLLEEYARLNVRAEYASEFRYRSALVDENTVVIAVSQSGETIDTLGAVRKGREAGSLAMGICNVVGSTISRETVCGIYTHAGPEIGVASTKAFTSQVAVFILMALELGVKRGLPKEEALRIAGALSGIGESVRTILEMSEDIREIAISYRHVRNFLYLGRGLNFPVALEGALKLKEISYIHAEGYPAAEMKHGPIALIDDNMPVVVIAPKGATYEKILSNMQEVKARHGKLVTVTDHPTKEIARLADHMIVIPHVHRAVFPLLAVIPLQLLAYHMAVINGCDVDQPRHLAKSVTVE